MDPAIVDLLTATTGPLGTALVAAFFWARGERRKICASIDALSDRVDTIQATLDRLRGPVVVAGKDVGIGG